SAFTVFGVTPIMPFCHQPTGNDMRVFAGPSSIYRATFHRFRCSLTHPLPLLMLLALPLTSQAQAPAGPIKNIALPGLSGTIVIDGRLDDAQWTQATLIEDLHQVFPQEFAPATERTEVRVFYTED